MEQSVQTAPVLITENLAASSDLGKLFEALAKAQGELRPAVLDMVNPHFNSKYASLTSCQDAYREPLSKNGLSIIQQVYTGKEGYYIRTTLGHSSGQWMSNVFKLLLDKQNMQGLGSAVTYARRYGINALVGLVDIEDDDGNAASPKPAGKSNPEPATKPDTASKPPAKSATEPAKQAPPNNLAPATPEMQNQIIDLLITRGIAESELTLVLINGYAHTKGVAPIWIAKEVIGELSKPETTSETFAKFGELVKARREAAHLRKQVQSQNQTPS